MTLQTILVTKFNYTYDEFRKVVEKDALVDERSKLNVQRMKRVEKQVELSEVFQDFDRDFPDWVWLIIAEPWCGDGAQNIPVLQKITSNFPKIEIQIILRDEHPQIIDKYLTNGSRSIPKLICFDKTSGEELWQWGPRPSALIEEIAIIKSANPEISKDDLHQIIHLWYAKDRGKSVQADILAEMKKIC